MGLIWSTFEPFPRHFGEVHRAFVVFSRLSPLAGGLISVYLSHEGGEGILLIFSYRNMGQDVDYFRASHWVNVYQAGVECDCTIAINGAMNIVDTWSIKVLPGAEFTEMRWAVQLRGESDVIDVEIEDHTAKPWKSAGIVTIALPD